VRLRGPESLHKLLARLDCEAATQIAPRDTQKIIRAIEIRVLTGKPVGEIHRGGRDSLQGYDVTKIGLLPSRAELYARIDARVGAMIDAGWEEEVRSLVANGVPPHAKPFQFIGYSQLREWIASGQGLGDAVKQIQQATRRFAKRQITWFRREPDVRWLPGFGDDPDAVDEALRLAQAKS
jgi:tRNA dimethylallyltransferase